MQISINVLNVRDGDAIIVELSKDSSHLIILVDAGHSGDSQTIINNLSGPLKSANKLAPDLIICTHYDSDHIGGMTGVINEYKGNIKEIWIHRTTQILEISKLKSNTIVESTFPSENDTFLGGNMNQNSTENRLRDLIIESAVQEKKLIELIDSLNIPCKEPIAGLCSYDGWEELEVLGPTEVYYKKLFPDHFNTEIYLKEEVSILQEVNDQGNMDILDPCEMLENLPKTRVTNPNLNSVIFKIDVERKTFLFTGDAGIESFYNIPNYEDELKNIFWLKLPHHGSRNNINCDLISIFSPQHAAVSGSKYIDKSVIECLKIKKTHVLSTNELNNNIEYKF